MKIRRFGKTQISMPVLSCGAMRLQQSWKDVPLSEIEAGNQKTVENIVTKAFENGINHFETARGYGTSESQLGQILPKLPRDEIIVQTKIGPRNSEEDFMKDFEKSWSNLQLEHIELLAIHGINTVELLDKTLNNGTLAACLKLRDKGRISHIGFSTHAGPDTVIPAIECGEFSFVNLHWYYFDQRNTAAIEKAANNDMGVFIISPNDKGGKLQDPPEKLVNLCKPYSPMQFNDIFCLSNDNVHTISIGASKPSDFIEHLAILEDIGHGADKIAPVKEKLENEFAAVMGKDWAEHWQEGLPPMVEAPEPLPLYFILRLYNLAVSFDMLEYARQRYNLLENGGHWVPGCKVDTINWPQLKKALRDYKFADRVPELLRKAHELLNKKPEKRLSKSES